MSDSIVKLQMAELAKVLNQCYNRWYRSVHIERETDVVKYEHNLNTQWV